MCMGVHVRYGCILEVCSGRVYLYVDVLCMSSEYVYLYVYMCVCVSLCWVCICDLYTIFFQSFPRQLVYILEVFDQAVYRTSAMEMSLLINTTGFRYGFLSTLASSIINSRHSKKRVFSRINLWCLL